METIGITADNRDQVVSVHRAGDVIADKRLNRGASNGLPDC